MPVCRYFKKIQFLDYLISKKATGSQKHLAKKMGMSRSMLNEYINDMKELGFPIKFDRVKNTYYYETSGSMVKSLFTKDLSLEEMRNYPGGKDTEITVYQEYFRHII